MKYISQMPTGLCYTLQKRDGKTVSSLDMTRTAINMIPKGLKVDRVVVNTDQLSYVAPDYRGQVVSVSLEISDEGVQKVEEVMPRKSIGALKMAYQRKLTYSPLYFDNSLQNKYGQEQHLPADLVFRKDLRLLDAGRTVLDVPPRIFGIDGLIMPGRYLKWNRDQLRHRAKIVEKETASKDYGAIRNLCHRRVRISPCHPDKLVK